MSKNVRISTRTSTSPVPVPRTVRNHDLTILTSMPAGRMTPIAAIPLLREDAARVRVSAAFQMMETADMLINEVNLSVKAYLVPHLAFERFQSMDDLNRSWEGQPPRPNLPVVPFVETMVVPANFATADLVHRYLGRHAKPGDQISTAYIEAYNMIYNFRAKNRSPHITERARLQSSTLAPAFWHHSRFAHIVPDFDQAVMDGNVALNVINGKLPVYGIGIHPGKGIAANHQSQESGKRAGETRAGWAIVDGNRPPELGTGHIIMKSQNLPGNPVVQAPDIWAELANNGVTLSLANIDLARKTQAFARLREQYAAHDDDYIIDMLMDGLTVPEQAWQQPIMLQDRSTIFGMSQRYATNGADLTKSVVNGATQIDLNFAVPRCPTGGVIMIVAEALPGQLFERGRDPYLYARDPKAFPSFLRDALDPEPVEAVPNGYIDVSHATPNNVFGYAPLNHAWNYAAPCVGGRFLRPTADAGYNMDRERLWAVEQVNPILSEDFYVSRAIHTKPFVNPNQDPFEVTAVGAAAITGLTQFGGALIEATNNYAEVLADAPQERLTKTPVPTS